ncbi:MAG: RpiB/LacA/LacB family sugar-phosphate isomerase [Phycisphaeraceae bacterium]
MRIAVAADHAGFNLKAGVVALLQKLDCQVTDLGAACYDKDDDYPDFAKSVAEAVSQGQADRGIIVCGSGVGACVAANKVPGVRACMCHDTYSAAQGVEHDDLNVLCLGGRIIGDALMAECVRAFVKARFSGEERHRRRLDKVLAIEARYGRR